MERTLEAPAADGGLSLSTAGSLLIDVRKELLGLDE
jgi:hypothetical protein